jgi:hypothetical protein
LIQPTKYKPREKPRHRHGNERKLKDKNTEKIREGQAERNKQTTERGGRKRTRKKKTERVTEKEQQQKKKRDKRRGGSSQGRHPLSRQPPSPSASLPAAARPGKLVSLPFAF